MKTKSETNPRSRSAKMRVAEKLDATEGKAQEQS